MLDFDTKDHSHNSQNTFINFYSMKKKMCIATKKQIIFYNCRKRIMFYGWENVIKKFIYLDIIFTNILYIPILINNFYNVSYPCCYRYNINMKNTGKKFFWLMPRLLAMQIKSKENTSFNFQIHFLSKKNIL